ncbi:MAG: hypothetical protein IJB76_00355 [Clostridia bacterium]|nr:hypothetical protein [Clostridia bacterium]
MKKAGNVSVAKKNIALSAFWLFVAFLMLISTVHNESFSWLFNKKTTDISSENILKIHADEGLRMGYDGVKFLTSPISVNNVSSMLSECTSVDGRNVFFPVSEFTEQNYANGTLTGNGEHYNDANTGDFLFRKSTANDKNNKYISVDFTLSSDVETKVWFSSESRITGTAVTALRVSLDFNDGSTPIVFDSSQTGQSVTNNVVASVSNEGLIESTNTQTANAISNYYFVSEDEDNHLLSLSANEVAHATLTIWLEGADADCKDTIYAKNDLGINIEFSTGFKGNMRTIYFIDDTYGSWIADDGYEMYAHDPDANFDYKMTKSDTYDSDHKWIVNLPETTESVEFVRKSSSNNTVMQWDAGALGVDAEYHALGEGLSGGIWEDGMQTMDIYFIDYTGLGWIRANNADITTSYYLTDGNGNYKNTNYLMTYSESITNTLSRDTYVVRIRKDSTLKFMFKRYVNGVYDGLHSWDTANRNSYNAFLNRGNSTVNPPIGAWTTLNLA